MDGVDVMDADAMESTVYVQHGVAHASIACKLFDVRETTVGLQWDTALEGGLVEAGRTYGVCGVCTECCDEFRQNEWAACGDKARGDSLYMTQCAASFLFSPVSLDMFDIAVDLYVDGGVWNGDAVAGQLNFRERCDVTGDMLLEKAAEVLDKWDVVSASVGSSLRHLFPISPKRAYAQSMVRVMLVHVTPKKDE